LNPGRRGGKPATNRLSYGAAFTALPSSGMETAQFKALYIVSHIYLLKKCCFVKVVFFHNKRAVTRNNLYLALWLIVITNCSKPHEISYGNES
jgi:hypothetical protein